jgi:hypothetical protein
MNTKIVLKAFSLLVLLFAFAATPTYAQLSKKTQKKMVKQAKKEAKDLEKRGYYVPPGSLPLAVKLEQAYNRQTERDDYGQEKYITGEAAAVGGTKIAAKNQAMEAAKLELAGKIESNIAALTEQSIASEQLTMEEAASITETITAAKNIITQKLGRVIVLFEAYKDMGKNVEALVRIAYNQDLALEMTKETVRDELRKKSEDLHEKLDNLLNLNKKAGE